MKFGPIPVEEAEGAILAHATNAGARRLRKAHRLEEADIAALQEAGIAEIIVARLDPDDLTEDEAAERVAAALVATGIEIRRPATGRVNIHAAHDGLFTVDKALVDAVNAVHPDVTLATLPDFEPVQAGQMVATVKIIPFAVPDAIVARVAALAAEAQAFAVRPFKPMGAGLIQTILPTLKPSVLDKTARITAVRLAALGGRVEAEHRVSHAVEALAPVVGEAAARHRLVLVFGASAVADGEDVIPAAIRAAGGVVDRVGMPVDPGNLLVLGRLGDVPVIGAPGCARSPKDNGFDWILRRVAAGLAVSDRDVAAMGVGGLLTEIGTRPSPREAVAAEPRGHVHALLLAAGRSSRMGGPNKLLASFGGEPLIRRMARRLLASRVASATVVTGHQAERIAEALADLDLHVAHNPSYATGLSSSLKTGIAALPADAAGVLVMLGDMPGLDTADLDRMLDAFARSGRKAIVRATHAGKRGNPVILPHAAFPELASVEGDTGARAMVESGRFTVLDVELGEAASLDVDTPEAMAQAGGIIV